MYGHHSNWKYVSHSDDVKAEGRVSGKTAFTINSETRGLAVQDLPEELLQIRPLRGDTSRHPCSVYAHLKVVYRFVDM
jgi:hypothetical protein